MKRKERQMGLCALTRIGMALFAISVVHVAAGGDEIFSIESETPREVVFGGKETRHKPGPIAEPVSATWKEMELNGTWKYKEIPFVKNSANPLDDAGIEEGWFKTNYDDTAWQDVRVPYTWYKYKHAFDYVEGRRGWFRKDFSMDAEDITGKRFLLDFRRVADHADVWLNGTKVGDRHVGRFESFQYDVTDHIKPGANTLAVRVYDYNGQKDYHGKMVGGICGPVRMLARTSAAFAMRMKITTLWDKRALEIQAEITNPGKTVVDVPITVELTDWQSGSVVTRKELGALRLQPGSQWVALGEMTVPDPQGWGPDNPFLYALSLKDDAGRVIGMKRFGFREFRAEGEWFYLNGRKFKPRAFTFGSLQANYHNDQGGMETILRYYKEHNINMIRPHALTDLIPEAAYILCDEIGLLIYLDWQGGDIYWPAYDYLQQSDDVEVVKARKAAGVKDWEGYYLEVSLPYLKTFINEHYSHPSICMWSLGNEYYGEYYTKPLDKIYGLLKDFDRQGRPICTSSGRHTWEAMRSGTVGERTDVLDDHQYRGAYCGSWQENIAHIQAYAEVAEKEYGLKPKIDCEYGPPGDTLRYYGKTTDTQVRPVFAMDDSSPEYKRKYIGLLKDPTVFVGWQIRLKMNYCSPRQYVNEEECRTVHAQRLFKYPVEVYRRAGKKCLGGHTNAAWYDLLVRAMSGAKPDAWLETPLASELRRLYNPTLVSAGVFNQYPMPGAKEEVEVFVTNDLNEPGDFKVVPQLRLAGGPALRLPELDFGTIGGMEQASRKLEYDVPAVAGVARGRLEFHLLKNGKKVGDNFYPVVVINNTTRAGTEEKTALYDTAERVFRGLTKEPTTTAVLRNLGFKFEPISDFGKLDDYRYLIVGANSFDQALIGASETVNRWIKAGGKLLCFEQSVCGKVPFFPNYTIMSGNPGQYVSLAVSNHPAFSGLIQNDFFSWPGSLGTMFDYAIGPLDEGLVAVAPTAASMDTDSPKSVLADVRFGKGEAIFSQITATRRINTCSTAREYIRNLLNYFAGKGVPKYALEVAGGDFAKIVTVEDKDAFYFDLGAFVNRGFTDDKSDDGKGGWTDFGTGFNELPVGVSRLQGHIPFKIIDPAKNDGKACLVLKGAKRPAFPAQVLGVPVNAKLNSVYFLHTAMFSKPGPVLKYVLHYEDGQTREFIATTENEIPDWWMPKDRLNAVVAFQKDNRGLYMSEFVNPIPTVPITSLDIVSYGESIPIVIAITGRARFASGVAGVGEQ